jgi:Uma2 family endonuclease
MAEAARRRWTLEEFLAFDDGSDRRHELFEGEIVAMTPPARGHAALVARLGRAIGNALRPPCEVFTEAGIVSPARADSWYQADLVVACTPGLASDPFITEPVLIVEVLSPSTETVDRGRKAADYREIASVEEILLVASDRRRIERWRRERDGWKVQIHDGDSAIELSPLGVTIDLGSLYDGILATSSSA